MKDRQHFNNKVTLITEYITNDEVLSVKKVFKIGTASLKLSRNNEFNNDVALYLSKENLLEIIDFAIHQGFIEESAITGD